MHIHHVAMRSGAATRGWVCLLVWLVSASGAWANPLATEAALSAFFSTPAAQPEGGYAQDPPEGFAGADASEAQLIAFLAEQRRRGADLNAYRRKGTLLHHAIRSGLHDTALWLLANGADPRLVVQDLSYPTEQLDALGVAIHLSAWRVVEALMRMPAYAAMPVAERAARYWPVAMQSRNLASALLARGFALPRFDASPAVANALLWHSLCTGQTEVAQALLQAEAGAQPPPSAQPGAVCRVLPAPGRETPLLLGTSLGPSLGTWRALERRLQWPVLPYVVAQVHTAADVQAVQASGLRLPWGDPLATRQTLLSALQAAEPPIQLLRAVPPVALKAALQDAEVRRGWLSRSADWPLADLQWALQVFDGQPLAQHLPEIMQAWDSAPATRRDAKDAAGRTARWALLTRLLAPPLRAAEGGLFLYQVPQALWPQWLAMGYRVQDNEWADWLSWVSAERLRQAWPVIAQHQPAVAQRSLTWLVAPLSVGPIDDPQAQRLSYSGGYWSSEQVQKALFLGQQGLRVPQPRWLAAAFAVDANANANAEVARSVAALVEPGWVRHPPPALRQQVSRAPLACQPVASAALRRVLARPPKGQPGNPNGLQPIARPGEAACAWLATWGQGGGGRSFNDEDFFSGVQHFSPCADGDVSAALWDEPRGQWVAVANAPETALVAIHAAGRDERLYVAPQAEYGRCGTAPAGVYAARWPAPAGMALQRLAPGHPAFDALALQCDLRSIGACLGAEGADAGVDLPAFTDRHWAADKAAFLAAVDRLDRPALNAAREAGLFAPWLDAAAAQLSASATLALPDKRRRMAWLLAQHDLLVGLSSSTLEGLVGWLPAEDWRPIFDSLRCTNPYALREIERLAAQQQRRALSERAKTARVLQSRACQVHAQ